MICEPTGSDTRCWSDKIIPLYRGTVDFPQLGDGPLYVGYYNGGRLVLNEHILTKICESETRNNCCQRAHGWALFVCE